MPRGCNRNHTPRRKSPSDQYNPQPSHEPPAQAPYNTRHTEAQRPRGDKQPMKKDNNNTDNNKNKIMTTKPSKYRNPGNDSLRQGRVGGDEENACKTFQDNATPKTTRHATKTQSRAQREHMQAAHATGIRNTAGQGGALRHTTALER